MERFAPNENVSVTPARLVLDSPVFLVRAGFCGVLSSAPFPQLLPHLDERLNFARARQTIVNKPAVEAVARAVLRTKHFSLSGKQIADYGEY